MPDLDWTLSVPLRRSWLEVCRWITSLAGGSSCRGNVGWLDVAPSIQLSLRLKRHIKWCATAIRVVITFLSVSARRSVELDDDKVVSEYEEDWPEGGLGSAIRDSYSNLVILIHIVRSCTPECTLLEFAFTWCPAVFMSHVTDNKDIDHFYYTFVNMVHGYYRKYIPIKKLNQHSILSWNEEVKHCQIRFQFFFQWV